MQSLVMNVFQSDAGFSAFTYGASANRELEVEFQFSGKETGAAHYHVFICTFQMTRVEL